MKNSIKQTLERLIRDNDFLEDGLYHGYVNLTSLATYLVPLVQKLSGKKTTIWSVTMTLSRIAHEIQVTTPRFRIRPEDMRVRTGISYMTFTKAPGLARLLNHFSEDMTDQMAAGSQLFSQLEGSREVTVLFTNLFVPMMTEITQQFVPKITLQGLVQITVHIPPEYLEQHGMLYYVVKQLNYFGVNIVEIYTTHTELSILVAHDDLSRAMKILE